MPIELTGAKGTVHSWDIDDKKAEALTQQVRQQVEKAQGELNSNDAFELAIRAAERQNLPVRDLFAYFGIDQKMSIEVAASG